MINVVTSMMHCKLFGKYGIVLHCAHMVYRYTRYGYANMKNLKNSEYKYVVGTTSTKLYV